MPAPTTSYRRVTTFVVVAAAAIILFLVLPLLGGARSPNSGPATRSVEKRPAASSSGPLEALARQDHAAAIDLSRADLRGRVVDGKQRTVANATVVLATRPGGLAVVPLAARTVQTNANGEFVFRALMVGPYQLEARHDGDVSPTLPTVLAAGSPPVTLMLVPGAALEVEVQDSLTAAPIANALVRVGVGDASFGGIEMHVEGHSDEHGLARFRGLNAVGMHPIYAEADGFAPTMVNLLPGVNPRRDHWRQKILLKRGVAIVSGRVLDARGAPIAGAKVGYGTADLDGISSVLDVMPMPALQGAAITDDEGRYTLATAGGNGCVVAEPPRRQLAAACRLGLVVGQRRDGVDLTIRDGVSLSGVVRRAGHPVAAATVMVTLKGVVWQPMFSHIYRYQTTTDRAGAFRFDDVDPAEVLVYAYDDEASSELVPVDLSRPSQRTVEVELAHAETIRGHVLDGRGLPVPFAIVEHHYSPDYAAHPLAVDAKTKSAQLPIVFAAARTVGATVTDGDGAFVIRGLPPGQYTVSARPPTSSSVPPSYATRYQYRVATGSDIELTVASTSAITGRVRYRDGAPVRAFTVSFAKYARAYGEAAFAPGHEVTSSDGSFRIDEVPEDAYGLEIRGANLVTQRLPGPIRVHGDVTDVGVIEVARGHERKGIVRRPDGQPAAGARVQLDGTSDTSLALQTTGPGGEFVVPAADAALRARADLDALSASWQTLPADGAVELVLAAGGRGDVSGVLIDRHAPVADRRLVLTSPGSALPGATQPVIATVACDAAGRFKFAGVAAGSYSLRAQRAGSNDWKVVDDVAVEPQKETTVVLDMEGAP